MNIKDMYRTDWSRITQRDYISRNCMIHGRSGRESLIVIRRITKPLTVSSAGKPVKIVEEGYSWVQIALTDARWWLTSMFDEKGTLLQIYFDITAGNRFDQPDNPTFRDMYLDVVMQDDGALTVLDRDELDEALAARKITPEEHAQALLACDELLEALNTDAEEIMLYCKRVFTELKALIG